MKEEEGKSGLCLGGRAIRSLGQDSAEICGPSAPTDAALRACCVVLAATWPSSSFSGSSHDQPAAHTGYQVEPAWVNLVCPTYQ